jgi:short-subunit dehydrogenase
MPYESKHPVALVTGASSGIGSSLSGVFAEHGCDLVLVARSEAALLETARRAEETFGSHVEVLVKDLSDRGTPEEIRRDLQSRGITIDVLVNNAGLGDYGPFHLADWDKTRRMLDVNIGALTHLTRLFLPDMVARGRGHILNIASTAAFMPGPLMSVYYASKAFVLHFSEAVAEELRGTGVGVTAFCPGPVRTRFQSAAAMGESRLVKARALATPDKVARDAYRAMAAGKVVAVQGKANYIASMLPRFGPRSIVRKVTRFVQEQRT